MKRKCRKCNKYTIYTGLCEDCMRVYREKKRGICERKNCTNKSDPKNELYAMGYIATVCDTCYEESSIEDKLNANRFRHAEG